MPPLPPRARRLADVVVVWRRYGTDVRAARRKRSPVASLYCTVRGALLEGPRAAPAGRPGSLSGVRCVAIAGPVTSRQACD